MKAPVTDPPPRPSGPLAPLGNAIAPLLIIIRDSQIPHSPVAQYRPRALANIFAPSTPDTAMPPPRITTRLSSDEHRAQRTTSARTSTTARIHKPRIAATLDPTNSTAQPAPTTMSSVCTRGPTDNVLRVRRAAYGDTDENERLGRGLRMEGRGAAGPRLRAGGPRPVADRAALSVHHERPASERAGRRQLHRHPRAVMGYLRGVDGRHLRQDRPPQSADPGYPRLSLCCPAFPDWRVASRACLPCAR